MVKKDFTEYERDTKDLQKNPLKPKGKDFNIFPPEINIKESDDQDPSVLPATPKLSMRKKAKGKELALQILNIPRGYALSDKDDVEEQLRELGFDSDADSVASMSNEEYLEFYDVHLKRFGKKKTSPKKLAVGDEFVTPNGTPAKVVDTTPDLVIWVAVDGNDFGSELVEEGIEEKEGPPYGHGFGPRKFIDESITKEVPLEEGMEFEEINE